MKDANPRVVSLAGIIRPLEAADLIWISLEGSRKPSAEAAVFAPAQPALADDPSHCGRLLRTNLQCQPFQEPVHLA
jgi:hypothetical protein